ncbi:MAG: hemerythrin family protein, partial [Nitrospinae bacterium]|nr:hemerythrin family protein [Nitrospinota bacterium]
SKDVLDKTFKELLAYTNEHFTFEEELLNKYNYPAINVQILEHRDFIDTLNALIERNQDGFDMMVEIDLEDVLKSWLTGHIASVDYKFSDFLKSKM